jgi:uncharacterized protein
MTPDINITIIIMGIIFLSAFIKAAIGFGESMIGMPVVSLLIGIQVASPLLALVAAVLTIAMLRSGWKGIDLRGTWRFLLAALIGTPLGVWGLKSVQPDWLTGFLGLAIVIAALLNLFRTKIVKLSHPNWGFLLGFGAGVLSGAYNISGPPTVLYGSLRRWNPQQFRISLQGLFLPVTILKLISHGISGLWTPLVFRLFLLSSPLILFALWLGDYASRRIPKMRFNIILNSAITVFGLALCVQSVYRFLR